MKVINWLNDHIEEALLVVFGTIMVSSIFLQVIMRTVGLSLGWSEELARYCFIWLVYIGVSYAVKKQKHIKIDVLLLILQGKSKMLLQIIGSFVFLLFSTLMLIYGSKITFQLLSWGQSTPALGIPMGFVYLATPVGLGLTTIRLIQRLRTQFQTLSESSQSLKRKKVFRLKKGNFNIEGKER